MTDKTYTVSESKVDNEELVRLGGIESDLAKSILEPNFNNLISDMD